MEESKPHPRRRPSGGASRSVSGAAAKPASSAHIIDLRQAKPAAAAPPAVASRPARRPKPAARPLAAPTPTAAPPRPSQPAPVSVAVPDTLAAEPTVPVLPPRRFWPAFWRFLVLVVILGLLVVGGLYLYVNYFKG